MDDRSSLHPHFEETVRAIAELHAEHDRTASLYERSIGGLTEMLTRPIIAVTTLVALVIWITVNIACARSGLRPFDPAPFPLLQGVVTLAALLMTILILTSQRYDYRLAERRSQLTLQFVMVSEQKVAKLIELVELQRRDNPQIADRHDDEALAMSEPADGQLVSDAVDERHRQLLADVP